MGWGTLSLNCISPCYFGDKSDLTTSSGQVKERCQEFTSAHSSPPPKKKNNYMALKGLTINLLLIPSSFHVKYYNSKRHRSRCQKQQHIICRASKCWKLLHSIIVLTKNGRDAYVLFLKKKCYIIYTRETKDIRKCDPPKKDKYIVHTK